MPVEEVDPFDLPDWLAEQHVLWQAAERAGSERGSGTIHGQITPLYGGSPDHAFAVDVLAFDVALLKAVCDEESRHLAHESWHYGQVALFNRGGRVTLAVPCTEFTTDLVCEAVRRFSRSVGAEPTRFLVQLRL